MTERYTAGSTAANSNASGTITTGVLGCVCMHLRAVCSRTEVGGRVDTLFGLCVCCVEEPEQSGKLRSLLASLGLL